MTATKHLVSLADLSGEEIWHILHKAIELKAETKARQLRPLLAGRTLGMVFQKPSLRTRASFEVAMLQLGGHAIYLSPHEVRMGEREGVADVARVLSRYVDVIAARTNYHQDVAMLAQYATVPVINALSDLSHPCQALADMLTILEHKNRLAGITLAYVGDSNNVTRSLLLAGGKLGMQLVVASPNGYHCHPDFVAKAQAAAAASGGWIRLLDDPYAAVRDADVIYTDVWTSMGQEAEREHRRRAFGDYQVNDALLAAAPRSAVVMHCLPAHRGEEIIDTVIDGPQAIVFDQAENRLHAQKAILMWLLG